MLRRLHLPSVLTRCHVACPCPLRGEWAGSFVFGACAGCTWAGASADEIMCSCSLLCRAKPHSADASVIVADMLPADTTFQALCKWQKQLQGKAGVKLPGLQKALKVFARSSSSATAVASELDAPQGPLPAAELLADYDTAALLGLAPAAEGSRSGCSSPVTPQRSRGSILRSSSGGSSGILRNSSSSSGSGIPRSGSREWSVAAAALAAALAAPAAAPPPPPSWLDAPKGMQLLLSVVSQGSLWAARATLYGRARLFEQRAQKGELSVF